MHYLGIFIASIFGYLLGSVLWSVHLTKWVKGLNIYEVGSKNPGATNTLRILGKRWGLFVALLDGFKVIFTALFAFLISLIPNFLFSETSYIIPCIFVLIGHCWPLWHKFRGGKAVSCFCGLIIVVSPSLFIVFFVTWWISAFIWRKVSLSSMIASGFVLIVMFIPWIYGSKHFIWQWNGMNLFNEAWGLKLHFFSFFNWLHVFTPHAFADGMLTGQICLLLGMFLLVYRHKSNIGRLKNGTEPQIYPKKEEEKSI